MQKSCRETRFAEMRCRSRRQVGTTGHGEVNVTVGQQSPAGPTARLTVACHRCAPDNKHKVGRTPLDEALGVRSQVDGEAVRFRVLRSRDALASDRVASAVSDRGSRRSRNTGARVRGHADTARSCTRSCTPLWNLCPCAHARGGACEWDAAVRGVAAAPAGEQRWAVVGGVHAYPLTSRMSKRCGAEEGATGKSGGSDRPARATLSCSVVDGCSAAGGSAPAEREGKAAASPLLRKHGSHSPKSQPALQRQALPPFLPHASQKNFLRRVAPSGARS